MPTSVSLHYRPCTVLHVGCIQRTELDGQEILPLCFKFSKAQVNWTNKKHCLSLHYITCIMEYFVDLEMAFINC